MSDLGIEIDESALQDASNAALQYAEQLKANEETKQETIQTQQTEQAQRRG